MKICKYCNKPISDNEKYDTYGDETYGCQKCEIEISNADMTPKEWLRNGYYWQ